MKNSIFSMAENYTPIGWPKTLGATSFISSSENSDKLELTLPFPQPDLLSQLETQVGLTSDNMGYNFDVQKMASANGVRCHPKIKNTIAVSSGKGGVGKSTIAVELALALNKMGAKVGILDADIHGPSLPALLEVANHEVTSTDGKLMDPVKAMGIVANSIGFLVEPQNATIWRGPMASKVLMQLYNETNWPELDYLIVDMPPGTSDIQLTLAQSLPVTAAIVVTTPQQLAVQDAQKGIAMFAKVELPVLGIVENMSYFDCSCGARHWPFGKDGINQLLEASSTENLGCLPIFDNNQGRGNDRYFAIAQRLVASLWFKGKKASKPIEIKEL